jgi:pimeloyl-ACP methyl ester carboxylesterase
MCPPWIFADLAQGLGRSVVVVPWLEWEGDHDVYALARSVLEMLDPDDPTVLVGHSIGGFIALWVALWARRVGGVRGLVLCDSGANTHGLSDIDKLINSVERDWGDQLWRTFARRCVYREPTADILDELAEYPARLDRDAVARVMRTQRATDLSSMLGQLDMPVLVVHGEHDRAREVRYAAELAAGIPDAELVLLDCGHTPPLELPDEFARAVELWLARKELLSAGGRPPLFS